MAERVGDAGGIRGLLTLLDEHREALDYDCLTLGLDLADLGTVRFDWQRLAAVVRYGGDRSALARSVHGDKAAWSTSEHLLAAAVDALNAANWQRSGRKGGKPKPVPRPGDEKAKAGKRFGTASMPLDEADEFFARVNRRTKPVEVPTVSGCTEAACGRPRKARRLCSMHYQRWRRSQSTSSTSTE